MAIDAQALNKSIYNHGNNTWKTDPPPSGGSGQFDVVIPAMPGPAKQVYGGIPFAQGALLNTVNARVIKTGAEIPASFEVLCRWPDDSIKSLGVSVVTTTDPNSETLLALVYDQNSQQTYAGLSVSEDANEWTIDTGIGIYKIHKTAFDFLRYSVGGNTVIGGGDIEAKKATDGNTYKLSLASGFTLTKTFEDSQKVTFRLVGELTYNGVTTGQITIYYRFYYNCEYADITIQYIDNVDEPSVNAAPTNPLPISFSDYRVVVNHALTNYAFGTGSKDEQLFTNSATNVNGTISGTHRIDQTGSFNCPSTHPSNMSWPLNPTSFTGAASGEAAPGWLSVDNGTRHFYMMQRYFYQQFPGRLEVTATTASIYFHSNFEQTADLTYPAQGATYTRPNTMYARKRGTSKSYDIRIGGRNAAPNLTDIANLKNAFDVYHLHLCADAQQIADSQILKDFVGFNTDNQSFTDEQLECFFTSNFNYYVTNTDANKAFYDFAMGARDFGNQLYSTNGITWTNGEHPGKYSYVQYWLADKSRATSFMMRSRMLWERDKKVYRTRRKGYWGERVTTGNVGGSTDYYYPRGEPNATGHYVEDHDDRGTYVSHTSLGFLWLNYLLIGDEVAKEALTTAKEWFDSWMFTQYNVEYYPGNNNRGHGSEDQDRSMGLPPMALIDIYDATGDKTMFDPSSALVNWATYMKRYMLREVNQYGGFGETYDYIYNNVGQLDPRTNSATCDYNAGTGTWLQIRGGQANTGGTTANGNSVWMLSNAWVALIRFIDRDTALNNRSGLDLNILKECLYQSARHQCIWGWNASGHFHYSNQHHTYPSGAEGMISYSLARIYEWWHTQNQAASLIHPVGYYDQMSYLKDTILNAYWNQLAVNYETGNEYFRFGFWGQTDTGYYYEAIEAMRRVRALA